MHVERDICAALIDAAAELGIPRNPDFNGATQEGAGYYQMTARNGRRCSAAVGYLNPVRGRSNLSIITHAHVEGLLFKADDDRAADGVRFSVKGEHRRATLKPGGEVILSAGAIGSPQILQISGIGPGPLLQNLGIPARHALQGVGENLQDHLQIRLVYEVNVPTLNNEINNIVRRALIGLEYGLFRSGPMTLAASQVGIFAKTQKDMETPDIQFHFQPLSADKPGVKMHPFPGMTLSVCQLRPESRGRIVIKSPDAHVYPEIHPGYLSAKKDQETAVAGIKLARSLTRTNALGRYVVAEKTPGAAVSTDQEILDAARNLSQTIYHPTSTCRMGNDPMAVVDERLRVRGIQGLRIVDASVMPTIVSGNTNAPTIMIAEKASDMIRGDC